MLGIAGASAATAGKPVGAVYAAFTELLAEVVRLDTGAGVVAGLARVLTGLVVVLVACRAFQFGLDLAVILSPGPVGIGKTTTTPFTSTVLAQV